mmetsp:Transcript_48158/g.121586  ORF Transcript_48158/g.121586 Transcript_48158/m.121586 type:complete len:427 (+) Transcript_48158:211-1491(+)
MGRVVFPRGVRTTEHGRSVDGARRGLCGDSVLVVPYRVLPLALLRQPGLRLALALDMALPQVGEGCLGATVLAGALLRGIAHVDRHGEAKALHAAGGVDGVPKEAVARALLANHARVGRAAVHAQPDFQRGAARRSHAADSGYHVRCEGDSNARVVFLPTQSAGYHVSIPDRLHLVRAMLLHQLIKGGEHVVQHGDDFRRAVRRRNLGEAHDVRKHHGDVLQLVRNRRLPLVEALDDTHGQDLVQNALVLAARQLAAVKLHDAQLHPDARHELHVAVRLEHVVVAACVQPLADVLLAADRADHDDGHVAGGVRLADDAGGLDTGHARHHEVHENDVREAVQAVLHVALLQQQQGLLAVHGLGRLEPTGLEHLANDLLVEVVVVDAQDLDRLVPRTCKCASFFAHHRVGLVIHPGHDVLAQPAGCST